MNVMIKMNKNLLIPCAMTALNYLKFCDWYMVAQILLYWFYWETVILLEDLKTWQLNSASVLYRLSARIAFFRKLQLSFHVFSLKKIFFYIFNCTQSCMVVSPFPYKWYSIDRGKSSVPPRITLIGYLNGGKMWRHLFYASLNCLIIWIF